MTCVKRLASIILVLSIVFSMCACTPSKKIQDQVRKYLTDKYTGFEFELLDYTQDKETSGKYTVFARCKNTNIDFEMHISAMYKSDNYSVRWANALMGEQLTAILEDTKDLTYFSDIQWLDIYDGLKFREVDTAMLSGALSEVETIHRIGLSNVPSADEAAQGIYMIVTLLSSSGVDVENMTFDIQMQDSSILFSTNTESIKAVSLEELEKIVEEAEPTSVDGNAFYSKIKENVIEFYVDP